MDRRKDRRKSSRWYRETTTVFLGKRSLRLFDSDTGYWVICYMAGGKTLCYYWDPAKFSFIGKVDNIYSCGIKMCGYCSRSDRSRNIRVEAMSCREIYRWKTARYKSLRGMYRRIFTIGRSRLEDARYMVEKCFGSYVCIAEDREGILVRTKASKMRRLTYDRCDNIPRECDPDACSCSKSSSTAEKPFREENELNLWEEIEAEGEASDCVYFETLKKWVCKEYE